MKGKVEPKKNRLSIVKEVILKQCDIRGIALKIIDETKKILSFEVPDGKDGDYAIGLIHANTEPFIVGGEVSVIEEEKLTKLAKGNKSPERVMA